MSHTHTHAPGDPPHSHGPPQPQQQVMRTPDPVMQAVIAASFQAVDIALGEPNNATLLCRKHNLERCSDCDVDYVALNRLSKNLIVNPNFRCPPPPSVPPSPKLTQVITTTKEEGNALFKAGMHDKAIQRYTMAASIAVQRPTWEAQSALREELSTILSNRAAAYLESGDYVSSLTDADAVILLKRPWSKGHFRKAKALMRLERYHEARDAIQLGLTYEPTNAEMIQVLRDIEDAIRKMAQSKKS